MRSESGDVAISVKNLSKTYRLFAHPGDRVKQFFSLGAKRYHREFTALRDVSFDIKKGETVGIIGRNGSGKSTLLQLICGILQPSAGSVQVHGRIAALLELGAGFNPEFTGRENVYFYGALQGLNRAQMDARFDDIAAFADIGDFIDQPVRVYSSGMFVRLAFAAAVHVEPDILVIDEALAVGDAWFQAQCMERIRLLQQRGTSIVLVTHSLEQVAHLCSAVLVLDQGVLQTIGPAAQTLNRYLGSQGRLTELVASEPFMRHPLFNPAEVRWGNGAARITDIALTQAGQSNPHVFVPGRTIRVTFTVLFLETIADPVYGLTIKTSAGAPLCTANTSQAHAEASPGLCQAGSYQIVHFHFRPFLDAGLYWISLGVVSQGSDGLVPHDRRYDAIRLQIVHPVDASGAIDMAAGYEIAQA